MKEAIADTGNIGDITYVQTVGTNTGGGILYNSLPTLNVIPLTPISSPIFAPGNPSIAPFIQLNPTTVLTSPFVDPPFSTRASTVRDMYSVILNAPTVDFTYDIGKPVIFSAVTCSFRNNTMNTVLEVDISSPSFITVSVNSPVLVDKGSTIQFYFSLNQSGCESLISTALKNFQESISISVNPLNVTGPVFVRTTNSPLVFQ